MVVGPRRALLGGASTPSAVLVPVLWSQTDHEAASSISADGTTATRNTTLDNSTIGLRSDTSQSSGDHYVEYTIVNNGSSTLIRVGLANGLAPLVGAIGGDANGISYGAGGNVERGGSFVSPVSGSAASATYTTGDVIGQVTDFGALTVKWNKNGGAFSGPYSISTIPGNLYIACNLGNNASFDSVKLNGF
jgi:hypothetical protein